MSSEDLKKYSPTDPELIDKIVNNIKSKGIFDQFRKDCLADVDTKPAYQNLQQRVNGTVTGFLATQKWQHGLNKTQLRESLRRHTVQQAFLEVGVDRIVDQVVNPKVYSVFMPKVEDVVCELLGIEKPKPKPLALNFQKFKKSLEALPLLEPAPAPAPSPEPIKEEPEQIEKTEEEPIKVLSLPDEKLPEPPRASPTPSEKEEPECPKDSDPVSSGDSVIEVLNNDDDSNTIDEMPLLAASLDSDSNRGGSPEMDGAPKNSSTKIGAISEMSNSHSLLSTHPPLEYDSSTNNLSSLKSEEKISPSKKFDNFSNLGEKLKQADVNLRETSVTKKEEIMEENSDFTKSSENDTESSEMKIDPPSESNMSSVDAFRHEPTKMDVINDILFSEDSRSSPHSLKNKSRLIESRDDQSRCHKHEKKFSGSIFKDIKSTKADKKDESLDGIKETVKKDQTKGSYSSKHHESKSKSKEDIKDKSKSTNDKDKHRDDKHKSNKEKSHSIDKHGKSNATKERKDRRDKPENEDENKNEDPKLADSNRHSEKKKKEDSRSRHHSKDSKDSKGHRKVDDHNRNESKEKNKSTGKEKNSEDQKKSDHDKSKKDSGGKSSRSKADDRKHKGEKKKDDDKKYNDKKDNDKKDSDKKDNDKKDNDDDKKKSPRKRKSGRCDDDEIKSKNSRRSSDRDSNGNAGGGSSKSKSSNTSTHNGRKSSKSDKGRSHTKSKEPSNQSDALGEDCEINLSTEVDEADEVDMILMEINNSIQNENQRLNISEVLNEPTVKKPKIARNFHEIKKIMQARKDIDRRISNDLKSLSFSRFENNVEEKVASDAASRDIDTGLHIGSQCNKGYDENLQNTVSDQDVSGVTVPNVAEDDEDYIDEVPSATSSEIELKDCSIVVTDVLKGQLKNSSISSINKKRIILEDGAVKNITNYSSNSSDDLLDGSTVGVAYAENPSKLNAFVDESGGSSDLFSSLLTVEDKSLITESKVSPENNNHPAVSDGDKHSPFASTACNEITNSADEENEMKGLESDQMADSGNEDHVEVPDSASCSVPVLSQHGLDEECDSNELKVAETTKVSRVRAGPSSSSEFVEHDAEGESDSSIQTEFKKVPGKAPSAVIKTRETPNKSCTDQLKNTPVSSRSKRSNAGTLMYAILEGINEKVPPNKQSVAVNRSSKRKGAKLETSKNFESVSEPEVRSPVVNSKSSQTSDNESLMAEEPVKTCSADDGSDVSNKENDESNVTCKTRSQMMDVGPNEAKSIETRTTRRKNITNDLSEDLNKSADNNNIKGRVSLKCKNNRDEPGCFSEEMPGKVDTDLESKKLCTSVSNRHSTRKGVTPLYLRNTEPEKSPGITSADSCATNSLLDKPKLSEKTCKSMESLHVDKENITVPPTTCDTTTSIEQCLVSLSPRRKSCPDIFETGDMENRKSSSNDNVSASAQQEKSSTIMLDAETPDVTLLGSNHPLKGTVAQTGNHGCANRRSGRRFGNAGNNDSLPIKNNENGKRISRNSRKLSLVGDKLPQKSEDEGFSSKKRGKLDSSRKTPICCSVDLVNPSLCSEVQTLILPDIQHPSTITINIDSSINKISEDEPPQVTLYFDDSAVATFNSEADTSTPNTQTLSMSEDVQLNEHANSESIHLIEPSRVTSSNIDENASQMEESYSAVKKKRTRGKYPSNVKLHHTDSLVEDSSSSEFKGFSQGKPVQDYLEKEYKGFTDGEIQEATVQLRLLKRYIANQLQSPTNADNLTNRINGPPRAKKTRVASEGVVSSNISEESTSSLATRRNPRKRNFSLNSSPEKDKKEVLGGQCKAESKDSGLCESPEQPSFVSDLCRNDAVMESGESTVRTRKMANVPPTSTPGLQRTLRKDKSSGTSRNKNVSKTRNPQRYSTVDLYKPRPVVGRDARTLKTSDITSTTSRGRPKRST